MENLLPSTSQHYAKLLIQPTRKMEMAYLGIVFLVKAGPGPAGFPRLLISK